MTRRAFGTIGRQPGESPDVRPADTSDSSCPRRGGEPGSSATPDPLAPTVGYPDTEFDAAPPVAPAGYELLEEIGRGGMGVVYRAREIALDRDVAVKILQDRYPADGVAARRFVDEARITGQLQHPGIPPVHQVGTLPDGRPFLAMKLIKGHTLDDLLKEPAGPGGRPRAVPRRSSSRCARRSGTPTPTGSSTAT